jgi:hypothetical protein
MKLATAIALLMLILTPMAWADDAPLPNAPMPHVIVGVFPDAVLRAPEPSSVAIGALPDAPTVPVDSMEAPARLMVGGAPMVSNGRSEDRKADSIIFASAYTACGLGIAFSENRSKSLEIGLPILLGTNYVASKLFPKHKTAAYILRIVSPAGCFAGHWSGTKKSLVATTPPTTGTDPTPPSGPGDPGSGGGVVPPGGSGDPGAGGGTGGNGGGTGSGGSGTPPPPITGPCTVRGGTDCGQGNSGINSGVPSGNPFTPPGKGGQPGDGSKRP